MYELEENGLKFNFTDAVQALKFDQQNPNKPDYHDIQNMPRVDFVVELQNDIYFIEVKDPGRHGAADINGTKFFKKIVNGTLVASLIEKYICTFFFRWGENFLNKSVHYICLITLPSPQLLPIITDLDSQLAQHFSKKSSRWQRDPLSSCQVHNINTWTRVYPDWPITRMP